MTPRDAERFLRPRRPPWTPPPATTTLRLVPRRRRSDGTGSPSKAGRTLLYEVIAAGQIQTIHVGRLHKVPVDSLREYVERQRALAGTTPNARDNVG